MSTRVTSHFKHSKALCVNETVPPNVELIIREYIKHCTPLEIKNAIRVIGRKVTLVIFSNDTIQQMISDGTGVSDSDQRFIRG